MFFTICWALCATIQIGNAQSVFRTETLDNHIQTLRVSEAGHWDSAPVIDLNSDRQIEILFDALGASPGHYTYRILHCNADWTLSQLTEGEYLSGLQNLPVDDYAFSLNTRMDYLNYRLLLPNEDISFKVSGNYVLQIISGETGEAVLNACFSLVEPQANIRMSVSSITDKGSNSQYQAVSFELEYGNDIRTPVQELKVYVQQNNRFDNAAAEVKPLNVQNRKALYDHQPALIFEAGNEYRSFEMTTTRYTGLNIESVEYYSPYYHSILRPDPVRSNRAYLFYEDINGRVFIRNNETDDPNTEADYQFVHFYLPCEKPFPENVYILSEAFHNRLDARSQMEYSERDKGYLKTALLKEGYYNYLYVTQKEPSAPASTAATEGNYYQTENEYRVMVYARTMSLRYDKLIGVQTIRFK